jgi:hypothetical protein
MSHTVTKTLNIKIKMRTKTLLVAAAALAATVISSQAQVYSGIVGYATINLTNGYNLIANQLDYDGTGTNNSVVTFFSTNLVAGSTVLAWNTGSGGFDTASWINSKGVLKWTGNTNSINAALGEGHGVFVQSPSAITLTEVGNVITGTNTIALTPGLNIASAVSPIGGAIQTNLNYVPVVGDTILPFDPSAQGYSTTYTYINSKGTLKWSPSQPNLQVGQAVFIQTASTPGWTNVFVPQ